MFVLTGVRRNYAWGSRTAIPAFVGEEPGAEPFAELWFGAHASGPSLLSGYSGTLADLIANDPLATLGEAVVQEFGAELPFLFKLIAPAAPLSMQVHPSREQAREGRGRAATRGDYAPSDYVDANHKPELLLPFTEFEVLAGLRSAGEALRILEGLDHPLIDDAAALVASQSVGVAFTHLLTYADANAVVEISAQCAARLVAHDMSTSHPADEAPTRRADEVVTKLQAAHPGDRGVLASLLMEAKTLQPGEAMFVPTGTVHAYLSGLGAEIMANSDNVLRAGLTPKHVDVPELLRVLEPNSQPTVFRAATSKRTIHYGTPIRDFELSLLSGTQIPARAECSGPRIVLALDDGVELTADFPHVDGDTHLTLNRGSAAFVAHSEGAITVAGGRALHAGVSNGPAT